MIKEKKNQGNQNRFQMPNYPSQISDPKAFGSNPASYQNETDQYYLQQQQQQIQQLKSQFGHYAPGSFAPTISEQVMDYTQQPFQSQQPPLVNMGIMQNIWNTQIQKQAADVQPGTLSGTNTLPSTYTTPGTGNGSGYSLVNKAPDTLTQPSNLTSTNTTLPVNGNYVPGNVGGPNQIAGGGDSTQHPVEMQELIYQASNPENQGQGQSQAQI